MSCRSVCVLAAVLTVVLGLATSGVAAQPTAFSYQGSLVESGGVADGLYDFEFGLFSMASGGSSLGAFSVSGVDVVDGVFSVQIDFGSTPFDGSDRYLEIDVRATGDPGFTTLTPRVSIDSVPYATHADSADFASYASSGPFEPVDTAPKSSSGMLAGESGVTVDFFLDGTSQASSPLSVMFPIVITREFSLSGAGGGQHGPPTPQGYGSFFVEVVRRADASDLSWQNAPTTNPSTNLSITMSQLAGGSSDETEYDFLGNGVVVSHRFDYDPDIGFTEVLTIQYASSPFGEFNLSNIVRRTSTGYTPFGHRGVPSFGGQAPMAGDFVYEWEGFVPEYSSAGVFPGTVNPSPGGVPFEAALKPVVMVHHSLVDSLNTMWEAFSTEEFGSPTSIVRMKDFMGTVYWESFKEGIITEWSLNEGEDGGLFEAYRIEFAPGQ